METLRSEHAFTLLEILMAAMLFTVLVVAIGAAYPVASLVGEVGRHVSNATRLAEEKLEEINAMGFSHVTPAAFSAPELFPQGGVTFTRTVTVTPCSTDPDPPCKGNPNLTRVRVRVDWVDPSTQVSKNTTVTTMIHRFFYRFS